MSPVKNNRIRDRWKAQIRRTASEINANQDFSFIDPYIKNKRIILLGENTHGIANYFTIKMDLIRYLHEHHGFNVVVLESSLLEATLCKEFLKDYSADKQIQNGLLDIYHNEEMRPLFKEEWAQFIEISGIDPQPASPLVSDYMLDWLKDHTDHAFYKSIKGTESRYFELNGELTLKITRPLKDRIEASIIEYEELLNLMDTKWQPHMESHLQKIFQIIQRGIQNRLKWLQLNLQGHLLSGVARNSERIENLNWLINHYYKNKKIIIWAQNSEIQKSQRTFTRLLGRKSIGYWLHRKYPEEVYSIGLYAGSGKFASLIRSKLKIDTLQENHLESLLYETSKADLFLPLHIKNQTADKKMWFKRKWLLLETEGSGLSPKVIYPQDHYDAIIFIRKVSPPNYLKRSGILYDPL